MSQECNNVIIGQKKLNYFLTVLVQSCLIASGTGPLYLALGIITEVVIKSLLNHLFVLNKKGSFTYLLNSKSMHENKIRLRRRK